MTLGAICHPLAIRQMHASEETAESAPQILAPSSRHQTPVSHSETRQHHGTSGCGPFLFKRLAQSCGFLLGFLSNQPTMG